MSRFAPRILSKYLSCVHHPLNHIQPSPPPGFTSKNTRKPHRTHRGLLDQLPLSPWLPVRSDRRPIRVPVLTVYSAGIQFENSSDIGVFSKLTNSYCLTAIQGSTNFYSAFEAELGDVIPIVHTSIGGTRIIGRLTAGVQHAFCLTNSY